VAPRDASLRPVFSGLWKTAAQYTGRPLRPSS